MTTRLFFIRHGSHDRLDHVLCGRMDGVALSPQGWREARRAAERLASEPIAAVYTSPLQRARETAEPIGQALHIEPIVAEALNEVDVGSWTGRRFDDLAREPAWVLWNQVRSHHRAPGGETILDVQGRVARWIADVAEAHPDEGVVAVCHAEVIKSAAFHVLGLSMDHYDRILISPGALSVVLADRWGLTLQSLNERFQ